MLDVRGTSTARKWQLVSWSQRLEQGLHYLHGSSGLEAVVHTHVDEQGCIAASCARASFETTVRLGRVLREDHWQRWQSHLRDTDQVNDEPRILEH